MNEPVPRSEPLRYDEFTYPVRRIDYLPTPSEPKTGNFLRVLRNRHSSRDFGQLSDPDLNALLWFSNRTITKDVQATKRWEHRPSPSAGGRHPIDVLVLDNHPAPKLSLHAPSSHALIALDVESSRLIEFREEIAEVLPLGEATVLWFVAQSDRTSSVYVNEESLVWRDAGALLMTFCLTAAALNLSICALGPTGTSFVQTVFKTRVLTGLGGIAVGSPSTRAT